MEPRHDLCEIADEFNWLVKPTTKLHTSCHASNGRRANIYSAVISIIVWLSLLVSSAYAQPVEQSPYNDPRILPVPGVAGEVLVLRLRAVGCPSPDIGRSVLRVGQLIAFSHLVDRGCVAQPMPIDVDFELGRFAPGQYLLEYRASHLSANLPYPVQRVEFTVVAQQVPLFSGWAVVLFAALLGLIGAKTAGLRFPQGRSDHGR
jgi:hypothetical protein